MQKRDRRERGDVVVEATIILPIAILCVILLLYISIFICQKAMLQAALETTVVYFKNTLTDNFVEQNEVLSYSKESDGVRAVGNTYNVSGPLNPYDKFVIFNKKVSDEEFLKYFESSESGRVLTKFRAFFATDKGEGSSENASQESDLKLTIDYSNYILFKEINVTAEQKLLLPIDFSLIGIGERDMTVAVSVRVAVVDHDELIRDIDFAIDIIDGTPVGDMLENMTGKVTELYNKLKNKFKDNSGGGGTDNNGGDGTGTNGGNGTGNS